MRSKNPMQIFIITKIHKLNFPLISNSIPKHTTQKSFNTSPFILYLIHQTLTPRHYNTDNIISFPHKRTPPPRVCRNISRQTFPISGVRLFAYTLSDMSEHCPTPNKHNKPKKQCTFRADRVYVNRPNTGYGNGCRLILRQTPPSLTHNN